MSNVAKDFKDVSCEYYSDIIIYLQRLNMFFQTRKKTLGEVVDGASGFTMEAFCFTAIKFIMKCFFSLCYWMY